ncbi:hypothetical protein RJT34_14337 [Clitoria ternatea]|uniref:Uncharacterized protein n=1 Tax=Clitoria ternatea TaxID=43366 RepID=A0AAN9JSC5_CLITE
MGDAGKEKETGLGKQKEDDDSGNCTEKVQVVGEKLGLEPSNGQEKLAQNEVLLAKTDQINLCIEESIPCLPTVLQEKLPVKGVSLSSPLSFPSSKSNPSAYK